jgi:hypothetical protein
VTCSAIIVAAALSGALASQHVADRAFADRQGEDLAEQGPQSFEADRLGVVQVDHQRLDRLAEGRARLKPGGRGSDGALAAAGTAPAE